MHVSRLVKKIGTPILISQIKRSIGAVIFTTLVGKEELSQKNMMMFHLQKELLDLPYEKVNHFVKNFQGYVKNWLSEKITEFCLENNFLQNQISSRIKSDVSSIIDILRVLAVPSSVSQMTATSWCENVASKIVELGFVIQVKLMNLNFLVPFIKIY